MVLKLRSVKSMRPMDFVQLKVNIMRLYRNRHQKVRDLLQIKNI